MKKLFMTSFAVIALAFVACNGTASSASGYDEIDYEKYVESDTIHFRDSVRIVEEFDDVYDITFIVPKSNEIATDSIKAKIRELMECEEKSDYFKMAQEECKKFFDEHKAEVEADGEDHNPYPWEFTATYEFVSQSPKFFTIYQEGYDYRGGAHGMPFLSGYTFLRENGHALTWKDFTDNPDKLVPYIEEGFADEREIYMETIQEEDKGLVPPANDPWIEGNHIVFQYQAYEIGPYAMGTPRSEVYVWEQGDEVPDAVIKPFIKELIKNYEDHFDCCGDAEECENKEEEDDDGFYQVMHASLFDTYKIEGAPNIESFMQALHVYDKEAGWFTDPEIDKANGYFHYFEEGSGHLELYGACWNRKDGKKLFIVSYELCDFAVHEGHTEEYCLAGGSEFYYASANKWPEADENTFIDYDTGFAAFIYNSETKKLEPLHEPPFNGWGECKTNRFLILPKKGKDIKVRDGVLDDSRYTYHMLKWNGMTFDYVD